MRLHYKVTLLIATVLVVLYPSGCNMLTPSEITAVSPANTYSVSLREDASDAINFDYGMRFTVIKNESPLVENESLYTGSSPFFNLYPKHAWIDENVLWFGGHDLTPSMRRDEISVINETNSVISYLNVTASDRFLLLEVQPHTSTRLLARPQTDQTANGSWISCFGKFADGRNINEGRNFSIRGQYVSPAHYCIFVREEGVVIQSREFEGFEIDSAGEVVPLPEAKNLSCQ